MNTASATAQMKATTPWSMLGGRGGWIIRGDRSRERRGRAAAVLDQKKSPSRSRFRPRHRLTFRFGPCEPPRTTTRYCFVLLPRRARRKKKPTACPDLAQGVADSKKSQFANVE